MPTWLWTGMVVVGFMLLALAASIKRVPATPEERCAAAGLQLVEDAPLCERVLRCDGRGPGIGCRFHKECERQYHCAQIR